MHSITSNDNIHTMIVALSSVTPPECKTKSVPKKASVPPSKNVPPKREMCPKRKQQDFCHWDTFAIKTYFLVFIPEYTFVPNQNCFCPTLKHITLALGLHPWIEVKLVEDRFFWRLKRHISFNRLFRIRWRIFFLFYLEINLFPKLFAKW